MVTAVLCGNLIDGTGAPPRQGAVVVLEGDRIRAVGGSELLDDKMTVIDLSGRTVLPGLIDLHAHICMDGDPNPFPAKTATAQMSTFRAARNMSRSLISGVTTMREAGAPHGVSFAAKQAQAEGLVAGPRLLVSGAPIAMVGGHGWHWAREVSGADDARRAAREQLKQGADVIKLMATGGVVTPGEALGAPQMTVEEMAAAIEEAHKAGKRTLAHAIGPVGVRNVLVAGIDTVEHGVMFGQSEVDLMLEKDVHLVPTFSVSWMQTHHGKEMGMSQYIIDKASQAAEAMFDAVALAARSGVKIAMGTDAGGPGVTHGMVALELELMLKSGACKTKMDVILSATARAADAVGMTGEIGTVEAGRRADLLALGADPLVGLDAFRQVVMVIKDGVVAHRA